MGGQHRWARAFLAACHHIYFIIYYCIFFLWLIKLLLLLMYTVGHPSVRLSVPMCFTRLDQSKMVEVRITQLSPCTKYLHDFGFLVFNFTVKS